MVARDYYELQENERLIMNAFHSPAKLTLVFQDIIVHHSLSCPHHSLVDREGYEHKFRKLPVDNKETAKLIGIPVRLLEALFVSFLDQPALYKFIQE